MLRLLPFLALCLMAALPGCGFHLRGQAPLPPALAAPYLEAADHYTPLYAALVTHLRAAGAKLATDPAAATAVIHLHKDDTGRELLSVSARNIPTEYELTYKVKFSVTSGGKSLIEDEEISATRDFSFDETQLLAKEREQEILREALARDLVALVMRRLAAL